MNHRPDHRAWLRILNEWNAKDAPFSDSFTTQNRNILIRFRNNPKVTVIALNVSEFGNTTMVAKVRGNGSSKKKRNRMAATMLIDVFDDHDPFVFVKARSMKALTRAVLLVQPISSVADHLPEPSEARPERG
jgi:hypothetical protein